jgi:leucyl-tRNA synthetase
MYDMGHTPHKEPFRKLVHQGLITKDGAKMSKSKGNVVSPDEFIKEYGSDVFRMYLMFLGPFKDGGDWNDKGISGIARFVSRLDKALSQTPVVEKHEEVDRLTHKTIKKVTQDLLNMQFNTGIAALMEYTNFVTKANAITPFAKEAIVRLIAPLAPHFAEEMWHSLLGNKSSVFDSTWPEYDESQTIEQNVKIVVQINGKLRGEFEAILGISQAEALEMAKSLPAIAAQLSGKELIKEIYVPNKLVSLVIK